MAKNFVNEGDTIEFPAPVEGIVAGAPHMLGSIAMVSLDTAPEGFMCVGRTKGVWALPVPAEAAQGEALGFLDGALVPIITEGAQPFGKVFGPVVDGVAEVLIVQSFA